MPDQSCMHGAASPSSVVGAGGGGDEAAPTPGPHAPSDAAAAGDDPTPGASYVQLQVDKLKAGVPQACTAGVPQACTAGSTPVWTALCHAWALHVPHAACLHAAAGGASIGLRASMQAQRPGAGRSLTSHSFHPSMHALLVAACIRPIMHVLHARTHACIPRPRRTTTSPRGTLPRPTRAWCSSSTTTRSTRSAAEAATGDRTCGTARWGAGTRPAGPHGCGFVPRVALQRVHKPGLRVGLVRQEGVARCGGCDDGSTSDKPALPAVPGWV